MNGITMDSYDFNVEAYCTRRRSLYISKQDTIRIDDSNYVVRIDTSEIGVGDLKLLIKALIPDEDFDDKVRTEVIVVDTNITVAKAL